MAKDDIGFRLSERRITKGLNLITNIIVILGI